MKLPQALVRDASEHRLFIVTGKQIGILYDAHGDSVDEIKRVEVETPHYSDHEGLFGMPGRGTLVGRGGVYENKDEEVINKFTHKLAAAIKEATERESFKELHLFTPNYMINALIRVLPPVAQGILRESFNGNFTKLPTMVLVEKIEARNEALRKEGDEERMYGAEAHIMRHIPHTRYPSHARHGRG